MGGMGCEGAPGASSVWEGSRAAYGPFVRSSRSILDRENADMRAETLKKRVPSRHFGSRFEIDLDLE